MAEKTYADKRYYTNADRTKLVPEGSEEAAYLVVGEGGEVTDEMREKYGSALKGRKAGEAAEAQNIVVSGTSESGPAVVEADRQIEESREGVTKGAARTAAKKSGR